MREEGKEVERGERRVGVESRGEREGEGKEIERGGERRDIYREGVGETGSQRG